MPAYLHSFPCRVATLYIAALLFVVPCRSQVTEGYQEYIVNRTTAHTEFPLENLSFEAPRKARIALVLSGGGARGLVHIGVLKALEEEQIPLDLIVGTSIGSIIGGFYAAGFSPEEIIANMKAIDWSSIFDDQNYRNNQLISQKSLPRRHLIQLRLDGFLPTLPTSISQGQRVFQTLYNMLLKANFQAANDFDNLRIPFRAVATDLISGQKVVLKDGDLAEAINASVALPLVFAPVEIDSMWLIDGGVTDNLPVAVARDEQADMIIAVDATSGLRPRKDIVAPWEIADQVTTIMMQVPTEKSRADADVVITPQLTLLQNSDFGEVDSLVAAGYRTAKGQIAEIRRKMADVNRYLPADDRVLGRLREVRVHGAAHPLESPAGLRGDLIPGEEIRRSQILRELDRMSESGYLRDVAAQVTGRSSGIDVDFFCRMQPHIDLVTIHHDGALPDSVFQAIANEFSGRTLNIRALFRRLRLLKNQYVRRGLVLADIRTVRYEPATHELVIEIDEGWVGGIRIVGNNTTRKFVILREFPLRSGERFRAALVTQGIRNIYSTGLFDRVLINLKKEEDGNIVVIKVKERRFSLARFGARYSFDRNSEGFAELALDNFAGTGVKASIFGAVGDLGRQAEALFYTVRLFNTYLTANARFYYQERRDSYYRDFQFLGRYQTLRRGLRLGVGQQIDRLGLISAEVRVEDVRTSAGGADFPYRDTYRIRSVLIKSVVDKRDQLPFPNSGIYNRWGWEAGSRRLFSGSTPFTRVSLALEGYYPLRDRLNGQIFLFAGSGDLTMPFSEYFFIGGQQYFPGLYEQQLFGRQFVHGGLRLRYRIVETFPGDFFLVGGYAVGNVWERPDERIVIADFLQGMSIAIAMNSLLGPIQLSYGRIHQQDGVVQFSMGYEF